MNSNSSHPRSDPAISRLLRNLVGVSSFRAAEIAHSFDAGSARAGKPARAAVVGVVGQIGAVATAVRPAGRTFIANPSDTGGSRCGTDIAACAAVVGVRVQPRTSPVADDRAWDARVEAVPIHTCAILIRTWVVARRAAGSAVVEVVGRIGAIAATTVLARGAACKAAPAIPTEAAGVAIARPAPCEAV